MSHTDKHQISRTRRRSALIGVLGVALLGSGAIAATAGAAPGVFPKAFAPETAPGFTNTFSPPVADLKPACPEGIMGTPGSDPATKVLNSLNTAASFGPGGTVHYTYDDNPHANSGTANFTIQDCVLTYPAGTFQAGDFGPNGVLIDGSVTSAVLKSGTQIDGGAMSGISDATGAIHFTWTAPSSLTLGTWVCNFARDVKNNHGGGGNRKVLPTCYQLTEPPPPPPLFEEPRVFLAYADTFHTGAGGTLFKPTPWEGPGVTFLGCNDSTCGGDGKFDGGAIRLDNADPQPLTLTGASVTIQNASGSCTFRPWDGLLPASAGVGESFILTQTGALGPPMPAPCSAHIATEYHPLTNFDTSEPPGPLTCDLAAGGTPVIHLEFSNGVVLDLQDTDKILNTDGVDRSVCFGVSEATPWTELEY